MLVLVKVAGGSSFRVLFDVTDEKGSCDASALTASRLLSQLTWQTSDKSHLVNNNRVNCTQGISLTFKGPWKTIASNSMQTQLNCYCV